MVASALTLSPHPASVLAQEGEAPAPTKAPLRDFFVRLDTTRGPITMQIYYSLVPYTAGNFLDLVQKGFYNGLLFHRVEHWVIQGGDPTGSGNGNYIDPNNGEPVMLKLEIHRKLLHNQAGVVAMARANDPNSASCQFYIIKAPMPSLNGKYAVFGQVVDGLEHVFQMRAGDRIFRATILPPEGNVQEEGEAPNNEAVPSAPTPPRQPGQSGF